MKKLLLNSLINFSVIFGTSVAAFAADVKCNIDARDKDGNPIRLHKSEFQKPLVEDSAKMELIVTDSGWQIAVLVFGQSVNIGARGPVVFGASGNGSVSMKLAGKGVYNTYEINCLVE